MKLVEDDLGVSGSGVVDRAGFAHLTAEMALGHAGILLGIEVSRLARNNAEGDRLLDLCGLADTLTGDLAPSAALAPNPKGGHRS